MWAAAGQLLPPEQGARLAQHPLCVSRLEDCSHRPKSGKLPCVFAMRDQAALFCSVGRTSLTKKSVLMTQMRVRVACRVCMQIAGFPEE
jgi:hypothetical protein